jgi:hypothetical protein
MKKAVALVVLLLFSWLQTYQLCDASEDTIEDLPNKAQMAAGHQSFLSRPAIPDDDADDQVPQVFEQTLLPSAISQATPLVLSRILPVQQNFVFVLLAIAPASKDLSPPDVRASTTDTIGCCNQTFVASTRSLAPPLV